MIIADRYQRPSSTVAEPTTIMAMLQPEALVRPYENAFDT
jgi:hypothetical protein